MHLGAVLRARREGLLLSREEVADRTAYSVTVVKKVENGDYLPKLTNFVTRWVEVFGPPDDELRGLWEQVQAEQQPAPQTPQEPHQHAPPAPATRTAPALLPTVNGDGPPLPLGIPEGAAEGLYQTPNETEERTRLRLAAVRPSRADPAVVAYLSRVLAEHRRADDLIGPRRLIPLIREQIRAIEDLCAGSLPAVRAQLADIAAQYAQFLGWLYQDHGDADHALFWYDRTTEWALEADNGSMAATALSMKANQHVNLGQPERVVTLAQAAQSARWEASPGVRALAVQEEAYGLGLIGQRDASHRKLDEIAELVDAFKRQPDNEPPWIYFFNEDFSVMQRASVLRDIGRAEEAIPMFERGLAALPAESQRERGQYLARLAYAHFMSGDAGHSLTVAEEAASLAVATTSTRTEQQLATLRSKAVAKGDAVTLARLDELLRALHQELHPAR